MPTYSNSRDEEIFHGDFATPEDAAAEAFHDAPDLESVWVGENKKQTAHAFVDGESILESATERAYDEAGECSEDWLAGLLRDKAKCAELGKLVGDWIEANEPPQFWTVLNTRKIERAEMVAAGHLKGANVEVTGAAQIHRAASRERSERGSTVGLAGNCREKLGG